MSRCAVLLLLAACGRFGFDTIDEQRVDALPDAPPCTSTNAHDEDKDGIVDDCDICPMRADVDQADADGDRVGDACDPIVDNPRERFIMFDPFTNIAAWTPISQVIEGPDSVKLAGIGSQGSLRMPYVPQTDTLAIGVRTASANQGAQQVIAIIFKEPVDGPAFYCQLFDDTANASLIFTYTFDGASYMHPDSASVQRLANGAGVLAYRIDRDRARCETVWKSAEVATQIVQRPAGIDAQILALYAENIEVELDWFALIRTDP